MAFDCSLFCEMFYKLLGLQRSVDFACHLVCLLGMTPLRPMLRRQTQPRSHIPGSLLEVISLQSLLCTQKQPPCLSMRICCSAA